MAEKKTKWQEKNVGVITKYKQGAKRRTPVEHDTDGTLGGYQVEHYDGSQDAEIIPKTVGAKSKTQGRE